MLIVILQKFLVKITLQSGIYTITIIITWAGFVSLINGYLMQTKEKQESSSWLNFLVIL
jgi:hypothetical protein